MSPAHYLVTSPPIPAFRVLAASPAHAVSLLIGPLERSRTLAPPTVGRLRTALHTNLAQHLERGASPWFLLEAGTLPSKPVLSAAFAVRIPWSVWFHALSPSGKSIALHIAHKNAEPRLPTNGTAYYPSLFGHVTIMITTTPTAMLPPPMQRWIWTASHSQPCLTGSADTADVTQAGSDEGCHTRRRGRRGGSKRKQRGIRIETSGHQVFSYDGGRTGILPGGVMLGSRPSKRSLLEDDGQRFNVV